MRLVLVVPPFLRLAGSHNDRLPLELCYLDAYLTRAGHEAVTLNADATGAARYVPWRRLFDNFRHVMQAADGDSPLYDETVERVMSLDPQVVVVAAADNVTPWVDSGNAYVSAELARRLRALGVYAVGVGPFYTQVPVRFSDSFDAILRGGPSPRIVDLVEQRPVGVAVAGPVDVTVPPRIAVGPYCRDDVAMTALGCPFTCAFCFARDQRYEPIPLDVVEADIASRDAELIDLGDAILPLQRPRLRGLIPVLAGLGKRYTCEVSVTSITEANLDALQQIGVEQVKLGVESGDDTELAATGKNQTRHRILTAANRIKARGIRLSAYVLLGGPDSTAATVQATYEVCREVDADDYIINVYGHHDLATRDFRYDGHFSSHLVNHWGLAEQMPRFFDLQDQARKYGLGQLVGKVVA
ncbi:MAG: B12-binding domain-containing radical SAM protein [Micromonosporaceae bacterium]